MVSWSVMAIPLNPAWRAKRTTSSGAKAPSEAEVWRWRSNAGVTRRSSPFPRRRLALERAGGVQHPLPDHVRLEVDARTHLARCQRGVRERVRDGGEGEGSGPAVDSHHRQADAIDGHGALGDD